MALTSGYVTLVPEGRNESSQAVYCLGNVRQMTRPVGYGMIDGTARRIALDGEQSPAPHRTVPYGTALFRTCSRQ